MINEAIVLAGGLGTRLRSTVPDLPKCMAPVNGRPFIDYVINYLQTQGITRVVFALGYMADVMMAHLDAAWPALEKVYSVEDAPLGTGGAIALACKHIKGTMAIVTNGDTLFKVSVEALAAFHHQQNAHCTLSLKPMQQFDRYGVVDVDKEGAITSFKEKAYYNEGLINGGVYILNTQSFLYEKLPQAFSFEKDYLEALYAQRRMFGITQTGYFIDIGIKEDYERAQTELQ